MLSPDNEKKRCFNDSLPQASSNAPVSFHASLPQASMPSFSVPPAIGLSQEGVKFSSHQAGDIHIAPNHQDKINVEFKEVTCKKITIGTPTLKENIMLPSSPFFILKILAHTE